MEDKSGPSKTSKNVFFGKSTVKGGPKRKEELKLCNVGNLSLNKMLDFSAIHLLKDAKTTYV